MVANDVRAKRRFSQNWLVDDNLVRKLVAALDVQPGDTVVEVGPGTGALTEPLVRQGARVLAVEADAACVDHLRGRFAGEAGLTIVAGDVLEQSLAGLVAGAERPSFISNLPYAVTSPILFHVIESRVPFRRIVVTMQREVAQRLTAEPGTKAYGRLTVMVALYGRVRRLFDLPPTVFRPMPAVTSSAVAIEPDVSNWLDPDEWRTVGDVVRGAFATRRKTIANCLARELGLPMAQVRAAFERCGVEAGWRAERLAPGQFVALSRALTAELC